MNRGNSGQRISREMSESEVRDRKELIRKSLHFRRIHREESVKDLAVLLAISRGNIIDEELGCDSSFKKNDDAGSECLKANLTTETEDSTPEFPEASAPQSPHCTDNIAVAIQSPPMKSEDNNPSRETTTLQGVIRNIFSAAKDDTAQQRTVQMCPTLGNAANIGKDQRRLECSICLDHFEPEDEVAWAKDGGDPGEPGSTSVSSIEAGCDHIYHRECLVSWLLAEHDDCPLCRRKIVHDDADVRFAGWEFGT